MHSDPETGCYRGGEESRIEKEGSRRIRAEIRRILMSDWDPIGISDVPEASDEYDMYIGGIFDLLNRAAADHEIADFLKGIETVRMGLTNRNGQALLPIEARTKTVCALQGLRNLFGS